MIMVISDDLTSVNMDPFFNYTSFDNCQIRFYYRKMYKVFNDIYLVRKRSTKVVISDAFAEKVGTKSSIVFCRWFGLLNSFNCHLYNIC